MEFYGESPQYVIPCSDGAVLKDYASRVDQIVVASIERYMWGQRFDKRSSYWEKTRNGGLGQKDDYVRVTLPDGSGKGVELLPFKEHSSVPRATITIKETLREFEIM